MKRMIKSVFTAAAVAMVSLGVAAQTQNMVIVGKDGSETRVKCEDIKEVYFAEAPSYEDASNLLVALYSSEDNKATYRIDIASGLPDSEGDPQAGDFQLSLSLIGDISADAKEAAIPAGYYRIGNGSQLNTFDASKSGLWWRVQDGEDVEFSMFVDGTVDVRYDNGEYDIRCELTTMAGSYINARYCGHIEFSAGASGYDAFDTPQDVQFEGAQGRYFANWPYYFADDLAVEFYTGEFDNNGMQLEGYWLYISLFMPKVENPAELKEPKIADGVYTIDCRENFLNNTYLPFTFLSGRNMEYFGEMFTIYSHMAYTDKSGSKKLALITDGTITVSENGSKFVFDMKADNGVAITGSYSGKTNIQNKYEVDHLFQPEFPLSTLDGDRKIDFPSIAEGRAFVMGDYIKEGINVFSLFFSDPDFKTGDCLQFEVLSKGDRIADGTYPVNSTLNEGTAVFGCIGRGGECLFSWFADLDSTDADGVQDISTPINGGSFTIKTLANGESEVTFDLEDDNNHKITGSWTGKIEYVTFDNNGTAAPLKAAFKATVE